jgi:hypothetical protein
LADFAVERLDEGVVSGLARSGEVERDAAPGDPVAIISYDEKPGIQAIATTAPVSRCGALRRNTLTWCRSTRISACSAVPDQPTKIAHASLAVTVSCLGFAVGTGVHFTLASSDRTI